VKHPETKELAEKALARARQTDPAITSMDALADRLGVGARTAYRWSAGGVSSEGLVGLVLREVAAGWLPKMRA
jgi:hypothetical protein